MKKPKFNKTFSNILFIISIIGMTSIALKFFGVIDFDNYIMWISTTLLGAGLIMEGNIRLIIKYFKNGLTQSEITHILTVIVGLIVTVSGLMGLITGSIMPQFQGIAGIGYVMGIIVTIIERFV